MDSPFIDLVFTNIAKPENVPSSAIKI